MGIYCKVPISGRIPYIIRSDNQPYRYRLNRWWYPLGYRISQSPDIRSIPSLNCPYVCIRMGKYCKVRIYGRISYISNSGYLVEYRKSHSPDIRSIPSLNGPCVCKRMGIHCKGRISGRMPYIIRSDNQPCTGYTVGLISGRIPYIAKSGYPVWYRISQSPDIRSDTVNRKVRISGPSLV